MSAVKKLFNLILILLGVALIVICADLVSNKLGKTSFVQLDETDKNAIEELCQMTALFDDKYGNEDIWTEDYNLRNESCVITRRFGFVKGYTYAMNMNAPKCLYAQRIKMPEEYNDIPVYRFAYLTPFTFKLAGMEDGGFTQVRGKTVYASPFDIQSVKYNGTGSLEEQYISNTFAESVESVDIPEHDVISQYEVEEENIALTGLQYRIIDDMLAAGSGEKFNELLAEYVAVREYQNSKYPKFANRRIQTELEQGTALYVFYRISEEIDHNITYFNKEKDDPITFYSAYYYLCTGRYNSDVGEFLNEAGDSYVGAALCRIINDQGVTSSWQSKLSGSPENFTSQYTLLKRYCDASCGKFTDKKIDDIKRTYNYEEIISMARTLVKAVE